MSLTSHIMKVFERVVKRDIMSHLIQNNLINPGQHGFVPGRSTQTQLMEHYMDVFEALSEGVRIDTVYLDFAKAFDKVDHNILMRKVEKHRIRGRVGKWIREFLTGRKYRVVANGEMSEIQSVLSGVPQGTVLAAVLFIIMMSDIDEEVEGSCVGSFADDTKVRRMIKSLEERVALQRDLDVIYKWAEESRMKFNDNKFEQMSHGETRGLVPEAYLTPGGSEIEVGETVKDLGVIASGDLMFREHINKVVTSAKIKTGILMRTFSTRQENAMRIMFNIYIRSKLDYCSTIWSPSGQAEINQLERIQKHFTSKIEGMESLNYHERLNKMKLYSLERRRERFMIINAWRQIEGHTENILGLETKTDRNGRRILPSKLLTKANASRIKMRHKTLIRNSFVVKTGRLFNAVHKDIRDIKGVSLKTFKDKLDVWLSRVPDTPKIDGYGAMVAADTNSIIDQANYVSNISLYQEN